jgi:cytochrome c556
MITRLTPASSPQERLKMRLQRPRLSARALQAVLALAVAVPVGFLGQGVARSQPPALKDKPAAKPAPAKPVASKKPDANGYIAQFSIEELMESIVMPAAQAVWDAVAVDVTEKGTIEKKPQTEEDWEKLRWQAVTLVEATNLLVMPGRRAAHPGAKSENPGAELEPAQIQELLDKQRPAFIAYAHVLHEAAMQAVRAIDARNIDGISDAGGTIDSACESCHLQFWYPNQK